MAKYFDFEADSLEWKMARVGLPTSSCFDQLIQPKKLGISASRFAYRDILLSEFITGEPYEGVQTEDMWNGKQLEPAAINAYELLTETETRRGGFVTLDSGMAGCSPDRLVGNNGGVEIKNRKLHVQIGHTETVWNTNPKRLLDLEESVAASAARAQIQGTLLITEREWWDLYSHNQMLISPAIRIYRDEKFLAAFKPILDQFIDELLAARLLLEQRYGPFTRPERAEPDHSADGITIEDEEMILADIRRRNEQTSNH